MMREAVKDKSYRATPLGLLVGRYLRWFRNEWGATPSTIRDYEAIWREWPDACRQGSARGDGRGSRDVIDLWADREPRTRAKVTSVVRAFWSMGRGAGPRPDLAGGEAAAAPRAAEARARYCRLNADARLLNARKHPRDRLALLLLLASAYGGASSQACG